MNRPPLPAPPHRGGCLCGDVRYAYRSRPLGLNACHCSDCRLLSGSDYIKMVIGEREHFAVEQGETDVYRKRADSGREIDIHRCRRCGTRLWHEPLSVPRLLYFCAGTLDDVSWTIPTSHMYVDAMAPGIAVAPDAISVPGQPTTRETLIEAFARVYPEG